MGKFSNSKGKRGERELANYLRSYGYEVQRTPQSGGSFVPGDIVGLPGIHIEAKRQETTKFNEWIKQALNDCPRGKLPAVIHRRNNQDWHIYMPLEAFMELYKRVVPPPNTGENN